MVSLLALVGANPAGPTEEISDPVLEGWYEGCAAANRQWDADAQLLEQLFIHLGGRAVTAALSAAAGEPGCDTDLRAWLPATAAALSKRPRPASLPPGRSYGEGQRAQAKAFDQLSLSQHEKLVSETLQRHPHAPDLPVAILRLAERYADDAADHALLGDEQLIERCGAWPCEAAGQHYEEGLSVLETAIVLQQLVIERWPESTLAPESLSVLASLHQQRAATLRAMERSAAADAAEQQAMLALHTLLSQFTASDEAPTAAYRLGKWLLYELDATGLDIESPAALLSRRLLLLGAGSATPAVQLDATVWASSMLRQSFRCDDALLVIQRTLADVRGKGELQTHLGEANPLDQVLKERAACWAEELRIDEALRTLAQEFSVKEGLARHLQLITELRARHLGGGEGEAIDAVYAAVQARYPTHPDLPAALTARIQDEAELFEHALALSSAQEVTALLRDGSPWRAENQVERCPEESPGAPSPAPLEDIPRTEFCVDQAWRALHRVISRLVLARTQDVGSAELTDAQARELGFASELLTVYVDAAPNAHVSALDVRVLAQILERIGAAERAHARWAQLISRTKGPERDSAIQSAYRSAERWVDAERRGRGFEEGDMTEAERALIHWTPFVVAISAPDHAAAAALKTSVVLAERGLHPESIALLLAGLGKLPPAAKQSGLACELFDQLERADDWALSHRALSQVEELALTDAVHAAQAELLAKVHVHLTKHEVEAKDPCAPERVHAYSRAADRVAGSLQGALLLLLAADEATAQGDHSQAAGLRSRALADPGLGQHDLSPAVDALCPLPTAQPHTDSTWEAKQRRALAVDLEQEERFVEARLVWREAALLAPEADWALPALRRSAELLRDQAEERESLEALTRLGRDDPSGAWAAVRLGVAPWTSGGMMSDMERVDFLLIEEQAIMARREADAAVARFLALQPRLGSAQNADVRRYWLVLGEARSSLRAYQHAPLGQLGASWQWAAEPWQLEAEQMALQIETQHIMDLLAAPTPTILTPTQVPFYKQRVKDESDQRKLQLQDEREALRPVEQRFGLYLNEDVEPPELLGVLLTTLDPALRSPPTVQDLSTTLEGCDANGDHLKRALEHLYSNRPTQARWVITSTVPLAEPPSSGPEAVVYLLALIAEGRRPLASLWLAAWRELDPDEPHLRALHAALAQSAGDHAMARRLMEPLDPGLSSVLRRQALHLEGAVRPQVDPSLSQPQPLANREMLIQEIDAGLSELTCSEEQREELIKVRDETVSRADPDELSLLLEMLTTPGLCD